MRIAASSFVALSLSSSAALTGCATMNEPVPIALAGSEWRFATIDGVAAAGDATLAFQIDRLSAKAGCNRMVGAWRADGNRVIVDPLATTKMFCENHMAQENAVSELLSACPQATRTSDRLLLKSKTHSAELMRVSS